MQFNQDKLEAGLTHFATGLLHLGRAVVHIAAAAAPVAAQVAAQTGHADVVDDINKAGAAAGIVEATLNAASADPVDPA